MKQTLPPDTSATERGAAAAGAAEEAPLLRLRDLRKSYTLGQGLFGSGARLEALRGVSLDLARGEAVGLAGESGCGKSTLARCLLRLERPDAGSIAFAGRDLLACDRAELRRFRRRAQMVFQDPYSSLDPRQKVSSIVAEPLRVHGLARGARKRARVRELLEQVGLPGDLQGRYAHEFSGGQRQRIGIARALALDPELLIADEPVSALDVSVQAQILALIRDLQRDLGLTLLIISHDLAVLRQICDRIAVMYLGQLVELGPTDEVLAAPRHPYTRALLAAVPRPEVGALRQREAITGDPPSAAAIPAGCAFHPRCLERMERCGLEAPPPLRAGEGRGVSCHLETGR